MKYKNKTAGSVVVKVHGVEPLVVKEGKELSFDKKEIHEIYLPCLEQYCASGWLEKVEEKKLSDKEKKALEAQAKKEAKKEAEEEAEAPAKKSDEEKKLSDKEKKALEAQAKKEAEEEAEAPAKKSDEEKK